MNASKNKSAIILLIFVVVFMVFIGRLLYIQILNDRWKINAQNILQIKKEIPATRGQFIDRFGRVLASSAFLYDIYVTPNKLKNIDTSAFCKLFRITKQTFLKNIHKCRTGYNVGYLPSKFITGIPVEEFSKIVHALHQYEGISFKINEYRVYPHRVGAHILGYVRHIDYETFIANQKSETPYYKRNDKIGVQGLEKMYEKNLRGVRGVKHFQRDRMGKVKKVVNINPAKKGDLIEISIDAELQKYGEKLMANKIGSIVAIEPKTGEILAMISAPCYNPNDLNEHTFSKNWSKMNANDSLRPLVNKAVYNSTYRPGSIFKIVQSLIGLEYGYISKNTYIYCNKKKIGCHHHKPPKTLSLALQHSCNPYFYEVYRRMILQGRSNQSIFAKTRSNIEIWKRRVESFGLGVKLKTDYPNIKKGRIPDSVFYDKMYGHKRWAFSTIFSNSIGEGEIGVSPIQMANLAAIVANKGYYFTPHFLRKINEKPQGNKYFKTKHYTCVSPKHFTTVQKALSLVVKKGTGKLASVKGVEVCGKTGTVQNQRINDHSVFMAFAPRKNPKIALAVYVEYGTWGGLWASMIASLMIEKYMHKTISQKQKEHKVLSTSILTKNQTF